MPDGTVRVARRRLDEAEQLDGRFVAVVLDAGDPAAYWILEGADRARVQAEAGDIAAAQGAKRRRIDRRPRRRG